MITRLSIFLTCLLFVSAGSCYGQTKQQDSPTFDPSKETISYGGQTFVLNDTKIQLHFESYLNSDNIKKDEAKKYYQLLEKLQILVAPDFREKNTQNEAYRLLKEASHYYGDHNVSESLGSAISSALNAMATIEEKNNRENKLKAEGADITKTMEFIASRSSISEKRTVSAGQPPKKDAKSHQNTAKYKELLRRKAEIAILLKQNKSHGIESRARAKLDFQAILVQLFMQRRFEHVIIGTGLYTKIFNDGVATLELKENSKVAEFFSNSAGVPPTIVGLESFAKAFIEKVDNLTDQSKQHISRQEYDSAANRLLEAYAVGEHLSSIQTLPLEFKQQLYTFESKSNKLLDSIDSRDFDQAKTLNAVLKKMAVDYRHAKTEAYISGFTTASESYTVAAFAHLTKGDKKAMFQAIENARSLWPLNPKIKELNQLVKLEMNETDENLSAYRDAVKLFDQLVINQDYLLVLKKENWNIFITEFNLKKDAPRLDQLGEIMQKYEPAILTLKECEQLVITKQPILAWEKCNELKNVFPNSETVERHLQEYQVGAATYVNLLEEAQQLTLSEHFGSALSCYLKAQSIYPEGIHPKQGIDDLSQKALKQ